MVASIVIFFLLIMVRYRTLFTAAVASSGFVGQWVGQFSNSTDMKAVNHGEVTSPDARSKNTA